MTFTKTTDLCDAHPELVRVADPIFRSFGGRAEFEGAIATLKLHEDNALVREALSKPGDGRVLVIDGGGSMRRALVGDQLAALAQRNGWSGIVVHGCIRDAADIAQIAIGVLALGTHPRKSDKRAHGIAGEPVTFAGVTFTPGEHAWIDVDGLVVAPRRLELPAG
ncbi:MAG: ribonuclease E activity regulator RraA [Myxococcota bacterium]|nr:ribonuclease E activity regulator RraA [Myxococcota bacterium]